MFNVPIGIAFTSFVGETMVNFGRRLEIEVVMLPGRYLKNGLFTTMLSISVADFSVALVAHVICRAKLCLKI